MPSKCRQHGISRAPVGPPVAAASIYLDHQATTPCDPAVVAAMAPWWLEGFANPSSRGHRPGLEAAAQLGRSREQLAGALAVPPEAVVRLICSCRYLIKRWPQLKIFYQIHNGLGDPLPVSPYGYIFLNWCVHIAPALRH